MNSLCSGPNVRTGTGCHWTINHYDVITAQVQSCDSLHMNVQTCKQKHVNKRGRLRSFDLSAGLPSVYAADPPRTSKGFICQLQSVSPPNRNYVQSASLSPSTPPPPQSDKVCVCVGGGSCVNAFTLTQNPTPTDTLSVGSDLVFSMGGLP